MRPEITLYVPSLEIGGAQRVMVNLAHGLAEHGRSVELMIHNESGALLPQVRGQIPLRVLAGGRMRKAFVPLCRLLRSEPPACVVSALEEVNVAMLLARMLTRAPTRIIISVHSTLSAILRSSPGARHLIPLVRLLYRRADVVVAVSGGVRDDLVRHWNVPAERIRVIYNPLVSESLYRQGMEPARAAAFNSARGHRIVAVGRLAPVKRFDLLIRALRLVRQLEPADLFIVGEGMERAHLEELARREGVADAVHLLGEQANPYPYLSRASVVVLSSDYEGLGAVLVEAMAFGVPVVSTNCESGPAEVLEGGRYGRLVPTNDVGALADAMLGQLREPLRYDPKVAVARFDVDQSVRDYLDVCGVSLERIAA